MTSKTEKIVKSSRERKVSIKEHRIGWYQYLKSYPGSRSTRERYKRLKL